jgi:UDP-N-acetylmuramoyl-tripeptide--D-alanyl-D-alanine ligase
VISSLKLLKEIGESKHKILITPGLIEQGSNTEMENKKFIKHAANIADEIIIVGESFKQYLKEGLEESKFPKDKTHFTKSTKSALELASKISKEEPVVLIENDLPDQYS